MPEVVEIIQQLTYETDTSSFAAIDKAFGKQFTQIKDLQAEQQRLQNIKATTNTKELSQLRALDIALQKNKQKIDDITVAIGKEFQANEKLNKSVQKSKSNFDSLGFAFTNIVRDSPYGILGIANNIGPALDSLFLRIKTLQAEGKNTAQVFSGIGASLFGMSTILSLVVVGLQVFGSTLFGVSKDAKAANEEYTKFLDTLRTTGEGAIRNADDQISKLNILRGLITTNATNSKGAFDQLKRDYPTLLANIETENELRANPSVFTAIEAQLRAREQSNAAQKVTVELLQKEREAVAQISAARNRLGAAQKAQSKVPSGRINSQGQIVPNNIAIAQAAQLVRDAEISLQNASLNLTNVRASIQQAQATALSGAANAGDAFIAPTKDLKDKEDELAKIRDRIREIAFEMTRIKEGDFEAGAKQITEELDGLRMVAEILTKKYGTGTGLFPETPARTDLKTESQLAEEAKQRKEDKDKQKIVREERRDAEKDAYKAVRDAAFDSLRQIYDLQAAMADRQIALAQDRMSTAVSLAERGNTELLRIEQDRLEAAQRKRDEVARKQIQLNNLITISEQAKNVTLAIGAVIGAAKGDPYTLALRVIAAAAAIGGAIAAVTTAVRASNSGFKEGGYTGDMQPHATAGVVHGREFVFTAPITAKHRQQFEAIHSGVDPYVAFASPKYLPSSGLSMKDTNSRLDELIDVVGGNTVNNKVFLDERGVHAITERQNKLTKRRFGK